MIYLLIHTIERDIIYQQDSHMYPCGEKSLCSTRMVLVEIFANFPNNFVNTNVSFNNLSITTKLL